MSILPKSVNKFRNKKKNSNLRTTNSTNENTNLNNSKVDNSKFAFNQTSNTISLNLPTLTKVIRTEEDFLFKSVRKIQNEDDVYNIENKLEQKKNEENNNDKNNYSRENYISQRETSLPVKIIDKEYENLSKLQKVKEDKNNKSLNILLKKAENQNNKIIKKQNIFQKLLGNKCFWLKIILIIFFIILLLVFLTFLILTEYKDN